MIPRLGRGKGGAQTVNLFDINSLLQVRNPRVLHRVPGGV